MAGPPTSSQGSSSASNANQDSMLAKLVVDAGLATSKEVQECIDQARRAAMDPSATLPLAEIFVKAGLVTTKQLAKLKPQLEDTKNAQMIPGYQILSKLGAGAMATVYKAKQISLDRMVAIKILPRQHTNNPQFVERFYYEGRAAAKLNHMNIVGALDVGKAGEFHYFVMEYVEGRTVYDDIMKYKKYKEADALRIVIQMARALDHAHKAGFMHRDVKPKNIMITNDGVAKLADMGLARAVSDREAAEAEQGKAFGTPYYISPEQIRGELDVDARADIYGLGATFYHMVTGQVPFDGPNPSAVMHKHLKTPLVPPDHLNPELSSGIGEIIEACMAKNRDERYPSAFELLQDLEAVARGEAPLQARRKFDLSSLATLEGAAGKAAGANDPVTIADRRIPGLTEQPIFWAAIGGWVAAFILLVILIVVIVVR